MSGSHFLAHHEPVCVAASASRDFRDAPGIFGGDRGAAAAPPLNTSKRGHVRLVGLRPMEARHLESDDVVYSSLVEMAANIRLRKISPVELVEAHLARIARLNPKLNAYIYVDAEGARRQAHAAEAALASRLRARRTRIRSARCTAFRFR